MMPNSVPTVAVADLPADAVLLDVREDEEWAAGHIDGARHVPMHEVPNRFAYAREQFDGDGQLVVLCKMGGRSAQVTAWLRQQGVDAVNLDGGMLAWATSGKAMVSENGQTPTVY